MFKKLSCNFNVGWKITTLFELWNVCGFFKHSDLLLTTLNQVCSEIYKVFFLGQTRLHQFAWWVCLSCQKDEWSLRMCLKCWFRGRIEYLLLSHCLLPSSRSGSRHICSHFNRQPADSSVLEHHLASLLPFEHRNVAYCPTFLSCLYRFVAGQWYTHVLLRERA